MLTLIDTDPGIDDALALLFAWGSPDLRLAGITTVAGNVPVADATVNLFRLLALRRPTPMPVVAQGAAQPLRRPLVTAKGYHGADGLGERARAGRPCSRRCRASTRPTSCWTRCAGRASR